MRIEILKSGIRGALLLVVLACEVAAHAGAPSEVSTPEALVQKFNESLPPGWHLRDRSDSVLPEGHYWGQRYDGPRGEALVFEGPTDVHRSWQDAKGRSHIEVVGKEALNIFFVPPEYRESLLRVFVMSRPQTAWLIFSDDRVRVYAWPSWFIEDQHFVDRAMAAGATSLSAPDTVQYGGSLSWPDWERDLVRVLGQRSP